MATSRDPGFVDQARKILGPGYVVEDGETTMAKVKDALDIPDDVISKMRTLREKYGLPIGQALKAKGAK